MHPVVLVLSLNKNIVFSNHIFDWSKIEINKPGRVRLTRVFDVGQEGVVGRADGLEGDTLVGVPRVDLGDGLRSNPAKFDEIAKNLSR